MTDNHEKFSLYNLLILMWDKKIFILFLTSLFAILSVYISLNINNIYQSSAVIEPANISSNDNLIPDRLGAVASIVGGGLSNGGGSTDKSQLAIQMLQSRQFFRSILNDDILINLLAVDSYDHSSETLIIDDKIYDQKNKIWLQFQNKKQSRPSYLEAHMEYKKIVAANINKTSGFINISVRHESPIFAKEFLDTIINELNKIYKNKTLQDADEAIQYLNQQSSSIAPAVIKNSISTLIEGQLNAKMLAATNQNQLLKVVDSPFYPELKIYPSRAMTCILITFFGLIFAVSIVTFNKYKKILLNAIK